MGELRRILELLAQHNVEFVLVGGYAAMAHGVSLVTRDVDICTHFSRPNLERLHAAMANSHPYQVETPQKIPFTIPAGFEKGLRNLFLATDIGRLDCLGEVLGIGDYAAARAVSIPLQLPFGRLDARPQSHDPRKIRPRPPAGQSDSDAINGDGRARRHRAKMRLP